MHLEVFSIAPLLDENFFQKSFDRLPDEGLWAHRKEKILRQKKAEESLSYARRRTSGPPGLFENESVFSALS